MDDKKIKETLSILWIFLTVNYIFCDVFSLYLAETLKDLMSGKMGGIEFTQEFLLLFSMIMEIPILMIVLSKLLKPRINKWLNIIVGLMLLIVQVVSLITGENYKHYIFFSIIEIVTLIIIIGISFTWKTGKSILDYAHKVSNN
ncbi:hypothetical protein BFP77_03840 [Maribacter sp. 4U21]|uniref:DUF6326 family protein n=1 Tax=Maribacter sp. 4U21 TaxID=1889779 RepID=UPI000C15BE61|nr:DUF6326 family protein [Maribacter sp. 4U21]PIB30701.1 hypothetical protein BFP77_03840 [Maribacter sp. 4U21]